MEQPTRIFQPIKRQTFKPLLEDTLRALQDPLSNPEGPQYKSIVYTIKNCELFRNSLPKHIKLDKFAELAKLYVGYEKHDYGSILHHEKGDVNKLCIVLEGSAVKVRSKVLTISELELRERENREFALADNFSSKLALFNRHSDPENLASLRSARALLPGISSSSKLLLPLEQIDDLSSEPITPIRSGKKHVISRRFSSEIGDYPSKGLPASILIEEADESDGCMTNTSLRKVISTMFNNNASQSNSPVSPNKQGYPSTLMDITEEGGGDSEWIRKINQSSSAVAMSLLRTDEDLLRHVASKNADIKQRFLAKNNITNAVRICSYKAGEYYGENFCKSAQHKENGMIVVASKEVHLLTLDRTSYFKILNELEAGNNEKFDMFLKLFPTFDSQLVDKFSHYFTQKTFNMDEVIYSQDEASQSFYILKSGEVKLLKDFQSANPEPTSPSSALTLNIKEIPVVSIVKNQVFGEEVLLNCQTRQYIAVANSPNTVAYAMDLTMIDKIKIKFGGFFKLLKTQAEEKRLWRTQKALELFESQVNSRSPKNVLAYTPKSGSLSKSRKNTLSWADVPLQQKVKPVFHSSSYQHFVEKTPAIVNKLSLEPKKSQEEPAEPKEEKKLEKYKNTFSRTYLTPKLDIFHNQQKISSVKSSNDLKFNMTPFDFNVRKELYNHNVKKVHQGDVPSPQASPTHKFQRTPFKAKTVAPIDLDSPKIIISPLKPQLLSPASGANSIFKEKKTIVFHVKSPSAVKAKNSMNIDLPNIHTQDKVDALNILSMSHRSKSAQKILSESLKTPKNRAIV